MCASIAESLAVNSEQTHVTVRCPWVEAPHALISWWEMNRFEAGRYLTIAANLGALSEQFVRNPHVSLSPQNLQHLQRQLTERAKECGELGLSVSARQFQTAAEDLGEMTPA